MSLHIRPFTAADQAPARRLILEGLGEHFGYIDETMNSDLDHIEREYTQKGHAFVVAEDAGQLIGAGALMVLEPSLGQMVRVSVDRRHRRRGIGGAIVLHLLSVASRRSLRRVQVETNHDWHDAIALYRRHGFMEYGRDGVSVYMALALGQV